MGIISLTREICLECDGVDVCHLKNVFQLAKTNKKVSAASLVALKFVSQNLPSTLPLLCRYLTLVSTGIIWTVLFLTLEESTTCSGFSSPSGAASSAGFASVEKLKRCGKQLDAVILSRSTAGT